MFFPLKHQPIITSQKTLRAHLDLAHEITYKFSTPARFLRSYRAGFCLPQKHKHLCYNVYMKQNKPITILLYEDDLPKLCEIRCVNCSRMLCKVNAHVKSISFGDGYDPESQRELVSGMNVVEQKCRGCDCIYKFLFQK